MYIGNQDLLWYCKSTYQAYWKLHTCANLLATTQLLFKINELEIQLCAWRQGESLASIVDSVFKESLINDSSANTAYIYWGSLWGQTCCSVIDGELQLKHASAAKKSDINKTKSTKNVRIADQQKAGKKGRDNAQFSIQPHPTYL